MKKALTESPWFAPGIAVAVVGLGLTFFNSRFTSIEAQYSDTAKRLTELDAKLDRRADALLQSIRETNSRIDAVLQQQATLASQVGRIEAELGYIRSRLDKVAEKLQVTSAEEKIPKPGTPPIPTATLDGVLPKEQFDKLLAAIRQQPDAAFSNSFFYPGDKVPDSVPVKPLPASIKDIRPDWGTLNYTVGKMGVALVDPNSKIILAVVTPPPTTGSSGRPLRLDDLIGAPQ
jgi:tetrahydromethanopterin S-methyltransferase subunit G